MVLKVPFTSDSIQKQSPTTHLKTPFAIENRTIDDLLYKLMLKIGFFLEL
jgi:hypothetical protein